MYNLNAMIYMTMHIQEKSNILFVNKSRYVKDSTN
jgi:hypothetical protein